MSDQLPDPAQADGATRRQLLSGATALAAAGAVGAGELGGELWSAAPALAAGSEPAPPGSDADRLRRLLSVERLMLYCYDHVLGSSLLAPRSQRLLLPLRAHERAHIRALARHLAALGQTPPPGPVDVAQADRDLGRRKVVGRLGQLQGEQDALHLLLSVEQVVVGAYFVALIKLTDPRLMTLAARIMASDAQHQALVGEALYPGDAQRAVPYGLVQGIQ